MIKERGGWKRFWCYSHKNFRVGENGKDVRDAEPSYGRAVL